MLDMEELLPSSSGSASQDIPSHNGNRGRTSSTWDKWSQFLRPDEEISFTAVTYKRRGLFSRKRQLILATGTQGGGGGEGGLEPRLIYVDPDGMEEKGQIPWTKQQPVGLVVLDDTHFDIICPLADNRA